MPASFRVPLLVLASALLIGVGYVFGDARFLRVGQASTPSNLQLTATSSPGVPSATPATTTAATSATPRATGTPPPTPMSAPAARTEGTTTTAPAASSFGLLGPSRLRLLSGDRQFALWLTTPPTDSAIVFAEIVGLQGADGSFWSVRFSARQLPAAIPRSSQAFSLTMALDIGDALPPFGSYRATLRLGLSSGPPVELPLTLEIAPAERAAELAIEAPETIYLSDRSAIAINVGARYADAMNVRAFPVRLTSADGRSLPIGFIAPSDPVTIEAGDSQVLSLNLASAEQQQTLDTGTYSATFVLTADNAQARERTIALNVASAQAQWRLLTAQATPLINDAVSPDILFDLWFVPLGKSQQAPEVTLISLVDGTGRSFLPEMIEPADLPHPLSAYIGKRFRLTYDQRQLLPHGVYTGTLALATKPAPQSLSFTLNLPGRSVLVAAPKDSTNTPNVTVSMTRWYPTWITFLPLPHFSQRAPRELLIYAGENLGALRGVAIPPARVVSQTGADAIVSFEPDARSIHFGQPALAATVTISDASETGIYTGTTAILSPDLASLQPLNVTVRISDPALYALIAIALGALFSWWLTEFLRQRRERDYQRQLVEQVRHEAWALREGVTARFRARREPYERELLDILRRADEDLKNNNFSVASQQIGEAQGKLDRLRLIVRASEVDRAIADYEAQERRSRQGLPRVAESLYATLQAALDNLGFEDIQADQTRLLALRQQFQAYQAFFWRTQALIEEARKPGSGADKALLAQAVREFADLQFEQAYVTARQLAVREPGEGAVVAEADMAEAERLAGPTLAVHCEDEQIAWQVGVQLHFTIRTASGVLFPDAHQYTYQWTVSGGPGDATSLPASDPDLYHTFHDQGGYTVQAELRPRQPDGMTIIAKPFPLTIAPSSLDRARAAYQRSQWYTIAGATLFASLTGLIYTRYFAKPFGSTEDYVLAFLWGAGVDFFNRNTQAGGIAGRIKEWFGGRSDNAKTGENAGPTP